MSTEHRSFDSEPVPAVSEPAPDPVLQKIYLDEAAHLLAILTAELSAWRHTAPSPASVRAAHTLAGASGTVGFTALHALAKALEALLEQTGSGLDAAPHALLTEVMATLAALLAQFARGETAPDQARLIAALWQLTPGAQPDLDTLPVFLEEGAGLLGQLAPAVLLWRQTPHDTAPAQLMLRLLHTVKGSAHMVGALKLAQHAHGLESRIVAMLGAHLFQLTAASFEAVLADCEQALVLLEQLEHGQSAAPGAALSTLRVRTDLLDELVNQAGEVSILRSKLALDVAALAAGLRDSAESLARLQRQLREVEIEAESHIASGLSSAGEGEFDPLACDRFTRWQEVTRMMAESVNDIAALQQNLTQGVAAAGAGLTLQARLTRSLQHDVMRMRMVPFASIGERLLRLVRQCAGQTGRAVSLELRGGEVEIDRSVLERMVAPFEHVLRNAIVHGIETAAVRQAAGKNAAGALLVQVSQQGNEVLLEFSDDGAGLDVARIRASAQRSGLLGAQQVMSDAQLIDLIFEPGFSTAEQVTELAGRGAGLDIVRAEAQALGGRIDTHSVAGQGLRFTIRLPLTLALSQVVLLRCGGATYAVPVMQVERVLQLKAAALAAARAHGMLHQTGQSVALHDLATLLGQSGVTAPQQRSTAVLLLRSGMQRLALQVDQVLGKREVVVKNIGPQLARMEAIAGATVLGTGEIVLILNPLVLAQQRARQPAPARTPAAAPARRLILIVDDSLTVRRVTQRLLERDGYRVLLAKDGVEALALLQDAQPDLMLVDIEMPRMNGFDLLRNVRAAAGTRPLPVIMLSSRSADTQRQRALALGVNAYFCKPFQAAALRAAIASLLASP